MGIKREESEYHSVLGVGELRQVIRSAIHDRSEVSPVEYDALDDPSDFAVLVEKRNFASNSAFQVHLNDEGDYRSVVFLAMGHNALGKLAGAASTTGINKGTVSLAKSRQEIERVLSALRHHDTSLRRVG